MRGPGVKFERAVVDVVSALIIVHARYSISTDAAAFRQSNCNNGFVVQDIVCAAVQAALMTPVMSSIRYLRLSINLLCSSMTLSGLSTVRAMPISTKL